MTNKDFYYIVTAADTDKAAMQKTIDSLRGFTIDCLPNTNEKNIIYGLGAWNIGEINNNPAMEESYIAGKTV